MPEHNSCVIPAKPFDCSFTPANTALLIIDMQRDFLEPGGFGEALGNDVSLLRACIEPCKALLAAAREAGLFILLTREGHMPDLRDVPSEKLMRSAPGKSIGDRGPMGRILIRGEPGNDIIDDLKPVSGEMVIDKPGKGAFYNTCLQRHLEYHDISSLIICGVTTEVCVHTTVREANDRGYRVIVPEDCCASYFPEFHRVSIDIISAQNGIFGFTCASSDLIRVLAG